MHELAIAQSIVDILDDYVARYAVAHVKSVRLQIGEAHSIVPNSLTFSFEMLTSLDPVLVGAELLIDIEPHRARCHSCKQDFPVVGFVMQCPNCHTWDAEVVSGTQFQVVEMEIESGVDVC